MRVSRQGFADTADLRRAEVAGDFVEHEALAAEVGIVERLECLLVELVVDVQSRCRVRRCAAGSAMSSSSRAALARTLRRVARRVVATGLALA